MESKHCARVRNEPISFRAGDAGSGNVEMDKAGLKIYSQWDFIFK
jgi:hypothetical protein